MATQQENAEVHQMNNGEVKETHEELEAELNGLNIKEEIKEEEQEDQEQRGTETVKEKENNEDESSPNSKGNEEKKIFCGGISYDTTQEDLQNYFAQYGPVKEAQVKYDRLTGRSRGFAFVEFDTAEACKASLVSREQTIKGKQCEIKPAKTRELGYMNKKIFVGGLPGDFPEEELRKHFEQYGRVEDVEWPFDKLSKARKNFAFVVFESEDAADRAAASPKQQFASRECDVKKAVPQNKRSGPFMRNNWPKISGGHAGGVFGGAPMLGNGGGGIHGGGVGGGLGAGHQQMNGGGVGGGLGAGHQQMTTQMYHQQNPWYQMNAAAAWYNATYNGGPWYGTPEYK